MNKFSVYRFPERIKRIYQKYFPNETNLTYDNVSTKIDNKLESLFVEETDIIPFNEDDTQ